MRPTHAFDRKVEDMKPSKRYVAIPLFSCLLDRLVHMMFYTQVGNLS